MTSSNFFSCTSNNFSINFSKLLKIELFTFCAQLGKEKYLMMAEGKIIRCIWNLFLFYQNSGMDSYYDCPSLLQFIALTALHELFEISS